MDARIRARRARVRADAVRRRQRRTLSLFVLLVIAAGIAVALRSPLFGITAIRVEGVTGRRAGTVERSAALERGQHLLTAPLEEARGRVEALPWVSRAIVRRVPPSTVAIEVTPRTPLLTVRTPRASWKIDEEGVLVDGGSVKGAPVLALGNVALPRPGETIDEAVVHDAVEVHTHLPAWLRDRVATYEVSEEFGLVLRLLVPATAGAGGWRRAGEDGPAAQARAQDDAGEQVPLQVRFGDARDLALKVEVIRVLLPEILADGGTLDVRSPANPVVVPAA